ncbi:MAG: hypothetical protein V4539_24455 [Bacteroidota bacterium]
MKKKVLFILVCVFTRLTAINAQDLATDSSFLNSSLSSTRSQYMKTMGAGSYLYNGTAYERYWNGMVGHPFFTSEEFRQGNLFYNGSLYEDVPLMYDMSRDVLVSKNFLKELNVKLLGEKISYFNIGKNTFVRIVADSSTSASMSTGFYERLYKGTVTVLGKYQKRIENSMNAADKITKFVEHDYYYIEKDGKYHLISGESDILSLFKEQRAELRKFLNRREINFKKDPAGTVVQAATYYEQLKK